MKYFSFWLLLIAVSFLNVGIRQSLAIETRINPRTDTINISAIASMEEEAQAETLYQQGNFTQAIEILQRLENNYAAQEDYLGEARVLRNLGLVYFKLGELANSETSIYRSLEVLCQKINCKNIYDNHNKEIKALADVLDVRGTLEHNAGDAESAQETWKQAVSLYQGIGDVENTIRTTIYQAKALQSLGLYRRAIDTSIAVEEVIEEQPNNRLKSQALQSLAEAFRILRKLKKSTELLEKSLSIAEHISDKDAIAGALIQLGNNAELIKEYDEAIDYYQRAAAASDAPTIALESDLNQLRVIADRKKDYNPSALIEKIWQDLEKLPISHRKSYARINFALQLMELRNQKNKRIEAGNANLSDIAELLADAIEDSRTLGDRLGEAYGLGYLGTLYEQNQQLEEAKVTTKEALLLAQAIKADHIAYKWQWQLGRILRVQGKREDAISSYQAAIKTLQSLRSDLVGISSDAQFSFRESVEPVYRELVGLLLPENKEAKQSELLIAREAIEALQLAELDNFFQDACLDTQPVQIDRVDQTAAVFYPIILRDRLEVIVAMPGQPLHRHSNKVSEEEVDNTLIEMRNALTAPWRRRTVRYFLPFSQKVYDWLIRPVEADLAANKIETLVFVLDGTLRSSPISALHDGEKYLTEKYNIGLTPGLQLLPPKSIAQEELQALTAGLTEARQGFPALPGVGIEFERIEQEISTAKLLNESFTETNFKQLFQQVAYPVVHLGTHGEFSSNAEDTFVLTWDDRINANELDNLLRLEERKGSTIELLILSACQTAVGDKRAALGLAGVAVRAGARSTMASLWYVSDDATSQLMTQFYRGLASDHETLNRRHTKSEALSHAQRVMLQSEQFSHPYYWAAFTLVGNWL